MHPLHTNASETPELATDIVTYETVVSDYIGIIGEFVDEADLDKVGQYVSVVQTSHDLIIRLANTAEDKRTALEYLLGFALQCQNSIDILTKIANDTSNDAHLRGAANKVIDIIESAYAGTLEELINKNTNIQYVNNVATVAINVLWGIGCDLYLPAKIAGWIADGVIITLDLFCDTGVSIDAYYKLRVTSVVENALRKQILSLDGDYLRREKLGEASKLYAVINLYCSAITKGYEYTMDYLDSVDKDSEYIYASYTHNTAAFRQFENEVENTYYSLYGY